MTENELKEYAETFRSENGTPNIFTTSCVHHVSTGVNTSARHAQGDISWMEYYRAFTNPGEEVFRCASCGRSISTNLNIVDMNDDVENAEGGHILFIGTAHHDLNYYIVPLCPECNSPSKPYIDLPAGTTAVEEIGAFLYKHSS